MIMNNQIYKMGFNFIGNISFSLIIMLIITFSSINSWTAGHSDAPLSKLDPQTNITDVFAFIGTKFNDPSQNMLNVLVQVHPYSDPGDGGIYDRFSDDALYSIHIANPVTGETVIRYNFQFSDVNPESAPGLKNPNTIYSYGIGTEFGAISNVGDTRQNYTQFYEVSKVGGKKFTGFLAAPPNVGGRTTPAYNDSKGRAVSGATLFSELDRYTQETIFELPTGEVVFAGPREDGFYADTAAIFDLLDSRLLHNGGFSEELGQDGGGVDSFKGFNVLTYAIQIPIELLPENSYNDFFFGPSTGVGVYASVSRRKITILRENGDPIETGPWIQVNRMGNPLFNELFVALKDKDIYNRTIPENDPDNFSSYALNPEMVQLINLVNGFSFNESNREDIESIFIPDVIRVNTSTSPVPLPGMSGFSRLVFLTGDITNNFNSGWPNGRRIGDDVVDITLTLLASGPSYSDIIFFGDNVAANDQLYNQLFPYLGTPHAGTTVTQRVRP